MERHDEADTGTLRAKMLAERDRLQAQAASMDRTFDQLVAGADLEPPDDEHDPDGTTAYERAQVASLRSGTVRSIAAVEAAIARLDEGSYGSCSACTALIPFARLEAVPGTDLCVRCASGRSREEDQRMR